MKFFIRSACAFVALAMLGACSPARTGVVDGALATNLRPSIVVKANAPFALAASGRVWASPASDEMLRDNHASFDFAVYADPSAASIEKFAYAAVVRLEDDAKWRFAPQGHKLPGQLGGMKRMDPAMREGRMYTLHVPSQGDWSSELLQANGMDVPEVWLAKRWVFSLDIGGRALAEYREPWPADMDVPQPDAMWMRDADAAYLRAFDLRAQEAFTFGTDSVDFSAVAQPASQWKKTAAAPDVEALVGKVMRNMQDNDDFKFP